MTDADFGTIISAILSSLSVNMSLLKRNAILTTVKARHIVDFACECYSPPKSILVLQSSVVTRSDFLQRAKNREDISHPITSLSLSLSLP